MDVRQYAHTLIHTLTNDMEISIRHTLIHAYYTDVITLPEPLPVIVHNPAGENNA